MCCVGAVASIPLSYMSDVQPADKPTSTHLSQQLIDQQALDRDSRFYLNWSDWDTIIDNILGNGNNGNSGMGKKSNSPSLGQIIAGQQWGKRAMDSEDSMTRRYKRSDRRLSSYERIIAMAKERYHKTGKKTFDMSNKTRQGYTALRMTFG